MNLPFSLNNFQELVTERGGTGEGRLNTSVIVCRDTDLQKQAGSCAVRGLPAAAACCSEHQPRTVGLARHLFLVIIPDRGAGTATIVGSEWCCRSSAGMERDDLVCKFAIGKRRRIEE